MAIRLRRDRPARSVAALAAILAVQLAAAAGAAQPAPTGTIGYLGCSMTRDTVTGYHNQGGTRLWPTIDYGGGTVPVWGNDKQNGRYWALFDSALGARPETAEIWWQLCMSDDAESRTNEELYAMALDVLRMLRSRIGDIPVHVSPQPGYVPPHVCKLSGADGPDRMRAIADRLAREGHTQRGPDFPRLDRDQLADRCHPNDAGGRELGTAVLLWTGGEVRPRAAPPPSPAEPDPGLADEHADPAAERDGSRRELLLVGAGLVAATGLTAAAARRRRAAAATSGPPPLTDVGAGDGSPGAGRSG